MRSPKWIAFIGMAIAAPAAGEMPVSPLGDIYESYNDCFKVATKEGFKPEVLGTLGWSRAVMTGNDGKPINDGPIIYGNPKRRPIIILSPDEGICTVMARLENVATFSEFKKAWGDNLPKADKNGIIGFYAEGHPIALRETGTQNKPALTISVMIPTEKN